MARKGKRGGAGRVELANFRRVPFLRLETIFFPFPTRTSLASLIVHLSPRPRSRFHVLWAPTAPLAHLPSDQVAYVVRPFSSLSLLPSPTTPHFAYSAHSIPVSSPPCSPPPPPSFKTPGPLSVATFAGSPTSRLELRWSAAGCSEGPSGERMWSLLLFIWIEVGHPPVFVVHDASRSVVHR